MDPLFSDPLPGNLDFRAKGFLSSSITHPKAINLRSNSGEVPAISSCAKKQAARHLRLRFEQHSDVSSLVRCRKGDTSEMPVSTRYNSFKLVSFLSAEKSVISVPQISSTSNRVKPARGERSDIGLPHILKCSKFTSFARADRSDILLLCVIHKPFKFR